MRKFLLCLVSLAFFSTPAFSCVGRGISIGALNNPRDQIVAQVLAILINERTGTAVNITEFSDKEAMHKNLAEGQINLAVEHTNFALSQLGLEVPQDPSQAYSAVKAAYLKDLNLVWLPLLGFSGEQADFGQAAPVASKETIKKFPALPRLIAKTKGLLSDETLEPLVHAGNPANAAREFLKEKKLI